MGHPCWSICYVVDLLIRQSYPSADGPVVGHPRWQYCIKVNLIDIGRTVLSAVLVFVSGVWRICLVDELADEANANSEVGKSSRTLALTIPSITGCDCLSCIICRISSMSLGGSRTSACASARGLSKAIATSISPPSFLIRVDRPVCIQRKFAKA